MDNETFYSLDQIILLNIHYIHKYQEILKFAYCYVLATQNIKRAITIIGFLFLYQFNLLHISQFWGIKFYVMNKSVILFCSPSTSISTPFESFNTHPFRSYFCYSIYKRSKTNTLHNAFNLILFINIFITFS